jgi:hypothetical protein
MGLVVLQCVKEGGRRSFSGSSVERLGMIKVAKQKVKMLSEVKDEEVDGPLIAYHR